MGQSQPHPIQASQLQQWLQSERPHRNWWMCARRLSSRSLPSQVRCCTPLSQSNAWLGTLQADLNPDQPVVVVCHAGVRSYHFGLWLLQQMPALEVWNLEGGIDAWSVHVDSTVPRY